MPRRPVTTTSEPGGGGAGWQLTYGDMITLVLTFFIFLIALCTFEDEDVLKWQAQLEQMYKQLRANVEEEGLQDQIEVFLEGGKEIHIVASSEAISFPSGEWTLDRNAHRVLDLIGDQIKTVKNPPPEVRVVGHTDDVPLARARGVVNSNLALSAWRAMAVVRYFKKLGVPEESCRAEGRGEYQPREPNDTPEGRARNRRVEIFIQPPPVERIKQAASAEKVPPPEGSSPEQKVIGTQ